MVNFNYIRQLIELKNMVKKIIVTTNEITLPAQKNCESIGFVKIKERINNETPYAGNYIDYEIILKQ